MNPGTTVKRAPVRNRATVAGHRLAAALLCAVLCALPAAPATALDLPALMALLSQQQGGEAEFSEQRFVKGLARPLTASGTLTFAAPDRFVRRTLKPRLETMAVDGNTVTMTRGSRSRTFTLDAAPEMVAIIEALRGTLTGNLQTLQRYFTPVLGGSADDWTLGLTPLEPGLAARIRGIRIGGRDAEVNRVEIQLADGDRSLMTIQPVRPAGAAPTP